MSDSLEKFGTSNKDFTVLAVRWDDISGPSIISLFPYSALTDPESVALQIYFASVTVFGQHGHSQRIEFSVPLLSLGKKVIARVAFDSWVDPTLRGKERPFFLAFIADQDIIFKMKSQLDMYIFEYLDFLKIKKSDFSSKEIWEKIIESYNSLIHRKEISFSFLETNSDYSIPQALRDLETSRTAWEKLKDHNQLSKALGIAKYLEDIDDKATGEAFRLVGEIFFDISNYEEAFKAFEKSADTYARIRSFEKSGEASCLAGRCAYHLQYYNKSIELLQAGALWIKDPLTIAALNYDMGNVLHEQERFEESNVCFQKAIDKVSNIDTLITAKYSSTFASKLMFQSEKEKEKNPSYAFELVHRSAEQRKAAANFFRMSNEKSKEASRSLMLAANAYFLLGNINEGVNILEETANLFIDANELISAAKALYDGSLRIQENDKAFKFLSRAMKILSDCQENENKNHLLGLILFEKAKIYENKNQLASAINSYTQALKNLRKSNSPIREIIVVFIQYAKTLFNCEDFEKSAEIFFAANKELIDIPPTDFIIDQRKKTFINALISLRRASTAYHNAGIIYLKMKNEKQSLEMFTQSVSLLIDWIVNNNVDGRMKVQKVIDDRISSLSMKSEFFILAESKYKLQSIIESLKHAKYSKKDTN